MSKGISPLVVIGGAAAAYFLFIKPGQTPSAVPIANNAMPAGATVPAGSPPVVTPSSNPNIAGYSSTGQPVLNTTAAAMSGVPTTYGINSGIPVGAGKAAVIVSNYEVLLAVNPNLGDPNYQMTPAENAQYLNNYLDLQQWDYPYGPAFQAGLKGKSIAYAAQYHWTNYGCAQQRIFMPLEPPDSNPYTGPQPAKKSSGVFGDILMAVTAIGAGVAEVASAGALTPIVAPVASNALAVESKITGTSAPLLSDAENQTLFCGAAILINILPFYLQANKKTVKQIYGKLDQLLRQYS